MTDRRHTTWVTSDRFIPRAFVRPLVRFTQVEAASGIVLLAAGVAAMIWANSTFSDSYFRILETPFLIEFAGFHLEESLQEIINDGLMTIFFFVVGLEIKRELVLGDLRDRRAASLPVVAALGGMVFPALIYLAFNAGDPEAARGWGIPMATDIAFAVGVVSLLGRRVPPGAKLFLLALAIADDVGAIIVIAVFYTEEMSLGFLGAALAGLLVMKLAHIINVRALTFYVPLAFVVWYLTLESGVHATLAGVAIAFLTPAHPYYNPEEFDRRARAILDQYPINPADSEEEEHAEHEALLLSDIAYEAVAPLSRAEHRLVVWSSFAVVPLFALANAGVDFRESSVVEALTSEVALGVALGLVLGKAVGISLFSWIAVRLGLGSLPPGTGWNHVIGLAAVGGIGFTVALFVSSLAFRDPAVDDLAKVGIFAGSLVAGTVGVLLLSRARPDSAT